MSGLFVKRGTPETSSLVGEAAALRWLGDAEPAGGMPVAEVVSASDAELVEKRVAYGAASAEAAERVGVALAITHAAGAPWWGAPPSGWEGAYRIGASVTPTVPECDAPLTWGSFFAEWRVMPYVRQARDAGALSRDEASFIERFASRLASGEYDAPQPRLVATSSAGDSNPDGVLKSPEACEARRNELAGSPDVQREPQSQIAASTRTPVARIHGDLWSGNLLWDADPANHVGARLIAPMAHGGHAETDLAMLALFGCQYLDRIVSAYNEASPLADGWRDRIRLHQIAPLLHHCALFGRSYVSQTMQAIRTYA